VKMGVNQRSQMSSASLKTPQYWLMKSEPDVFSIQTLKAKKKSLWDGVRNYTARNFMMKDMNVGDVVLFYHSNANPSGIAGLAQVVGPAIPDPTQFDTPSQYYDPNSTPEKPRWFCVEVGYLDQFKKFVSLDEINKVTSLKKMVLLNNSRLS